MPLTYIQWYAGAMEQLGTVTCCLRDNCIDVHTESRGARPNYDARVTCVNIFLDVILFNVSGPEVHESTTCEVQHY